MGENTTYVFQNIYCGSVVGTGQTSRAGTNVFFGEIAELKNSLIKSIIFLDQGLSARDNVGNFALGSFDNFSPYLTLVNTFDDPFLSQVPAAFFVPSTLQPFGINRRKGSNVFMFERPQKVSWASSFIYFPASPSQANVPFVVDYVV